MSHLKGGVEVCYCDPAEAARTDADVAVVIDVLRSFTVTPWLCEQGVTSVILTGSPEVALAAKAMRGPRTIALTEGSVGDGFDLGDSPGQVGDTQLRGWGAVQCSSLAARAVFGVAHLPLVLCAALVNAQATARTLRRADPKKALLVISGGDAAEEDVACADLIGSWLAGAPLKDEEVLRRVRGSAAAHLLRAEIADGHPGVHPQDLAYATTIDRFRRAMVAYGSAYLPVLDIRPCSPRAAY